MTYNLTGVANNTNIFSFFQVVNSSTNEWLIAGILIAVFVIIFISLKGYETLTALRTSAFITAIISMLFYFLNMLTIGKAIIPAIIMTILLIFSIASKE